SDVCSSDLQTDGDGNYSIEVDGNNAVLAFSYIGYDTQRAHVGNQSVVSVELISFDAALDEVIVTAYGTQTKESIAGSISTLKSQDLEQVQPANGVRSLASKVGRVRIRATTRLPGESPTVRFRGLGSFSSPRDPLSVVDGVPVNGAVASICHQDIDVMPFIKDAAANALYGTRGA